MSALTEALETILRWLKTHRPKSADSFQPGLSAAEIRAGEEKIGFKLPDEIYELYQWRNGTLEDGTSLRSLVYPCPYFLPFDKALTYSQSYNPFVKSLLSNLSAEQIERDKWYQNALVFIFSTEDFDCLAIPLRCPKGLNPSPVVLMGEGEPLIYFESLASMMQTLAERYETGAYYINAENYIVEEPRKSALLLSKHNSGFYAKILKDLRSLFSISQSSETRIDEDILTSIAEIYRFQTPEAVELMLEAFAVLSKQKGTARDMACYELVRTFSQIEFGDDDRVLAALVGASRDRCKYVREAARSALPMKS